MILSPIAPFLQRAASGGSNEANRRVRSQCSEIWMRRFGIFPLAGDFDKSAPAFVFKLASLLLLIAVPRPAVAPRLQVVRAFARRERACSHDRADDLQKQRFHGLVFGIDPFAAQLGRGSSP
jgi:hypothetical protein